MPRDYVRAARDRKPSVDHRPHRPAAKCHSASRLTIADQLLTVRPQADMSEESTPTKRFIFPRWANYALPVLAVMIIGGALYVPVAVGLGFSPKTLAVGYAPVQPVPYSHAMHAGQLGLDCRYCHSTVEKTASAAVPPAQICMDSHRVLPPAR